MRRDRHTEAVRQLQARDPGTAATTGGEQAGVVLELSEGAGPADPGQDSGLQALR